MLLGAFLCFKRDTPRMDLHNLAIAVALTAAVVTSPPIRSHVADEIDRMRYNIVRYQLCVDLRAVGEKLPGANCEPIPDPNRLHVGVYN